MGEFEGKDYKRIRKNYIQKNGKLGVKTGKSGSPPKGESYKEFYLRVKEFLWNRVLKEEVEKRTNCSSWRSYKKYIHLYIGRRFWYFLEGIQ